MRSVESLAGSPASAIRGAAAHAVLQVLRDRGVDVIFTCPGSTEAAVLDASTAYPEIRFVLVTHESIAIAAADGYARVTGRPAVAYLHTNVGLGNGIAHLDLARLARSPVVVLNGLKSTAVANRGGFTTAAHPRDPVRDLVVFDRVALRAEEVAEDLVRALNAATAEPGGPVYLGLPQDLMEAEGAVAVPALARRAVRARRRPDPASVGAAARALAAARRLVIVAGSEVPRAGAREALLALAERLDAPILLEDRRTLQWNGVPAHGPRFAGFYGAQHPAVAEADAIFFAGMHAIMEYDAPKVPAVPHGATIVHLASDPADVAHVDPADVALVGNARLGLEDLLTALPPDDDGRASRGAFARGAVAAYAASLAVRRARARDGAAREPLAVPAVMDRLAALLPDDCVVVGQATTAGTSLLELAIAGSGRTYHTTAGGSLGWGMGAALGIALGTPGERVFCFVGDGVLQFGIQALATAAALGLPVVFVVNDNGSYAAVRDALVRYRGVRDGPFPGCDIAGPDYAAVARAFGVRGLRVERLAELDDAVAAVLRDDGPSLLAIRTDPDAAGHG